MKYPIFFLSMALMVVSVNQISAQSDFELALQYSLKADSLFDKADYEPASLLLEKAVKLYEKQKDWQQFIYQQNKGAETLSKQGKYEKAMSLAQKSLEISDTKIGKGSVHEADAYNTLGLIQLNKGRPDIALNHFNQALSIYQKNTELEDLSKAQVYSNIGLVYWYTDNKDLALDYQLKALAIRKRSIGENEGSIAASYNDLGLIYAGSGENKKAEKYYENALKIYEDLYGENHPKTANAYINLATIYRQEGELFEALDNLQKSLDIWQAVYTEEHPNTGFVLNNMGQIYADQGNWKSALENHNRALKLYKDIYGLKHPKIANTYQLIGSVYTQQGEDKEALDYYQKALIANTRTFNSEDWYANPQEAEDFFSPILGLSTLQRKSRALETLYHIKTLRFRDLKMALETLELCDQFIAKIRQTRSSKKDKIALGVTAAEIYEEAIRLCFSASEVTLSKNYYLEKAFDFAEKSKAAVLLGAISDTEAKSFAKIPAKLLEKEKELKSEISTYEQKRAETSDTELAETYREKLFGLNNQYSQFIQELEKQFPDYYNLKYNVNTASVADIQQSLKPTEMLISYFLADTDKRVYGFMISGNRFKAFNVPMHEEFNKWQIGLQNGIIYQAEEVFHLTATNLYQQLFPKSIPSAIEKLIIIPSGSLGTIPFEVLLTKDTKDSQTPATQLPYLVKDFAISYNFSATLFAQSKNKKADEAIKNVFFCAPITFEENPDLPGTEKEVVEISKMIEGKMTSKLLLREEAQELAVKEAIGEGYDILHFATHGLVDQNQPDLSKIYLKGSGKEDGILTAGEIYNFQTNAKLVLLSACQTGMGKISKGEGIIGLSRAWVYAGAQNLAVSYWTVSDESTAQIMTDFYQNLIKEKDNPDFSQEVRQAKLKMITEGKFALPYYWAAFVLIGR